VTHPPAIPPADPSETTSDIARRDSQQLRHGRLGVFAVAFFVISAAAPLTAMAGGAPVAMLLGNGPGIPLAYVVVSVILLIFAVGYTAMARHHTSTGAFYSLVSRGLRQPAGGAAAMIALLGYNAMQIGLRIVRRRRRRILQREPRNRLALVGSRIRRHGDHRGTGLPTS
jgi:amino acid transporter